MNVGQTFSSLLENWQQTLQVIYPEREIVNLFRFAVEDFFGLTLTQQLSEKEKVQSEAVISKLTHVRDRLLTGEPLQYITGFTYFDELKISVSPAVLIPRPETEELVHWILELLPADFSGSITDWCTGSGCIALALKHHLSQAQIVGYDSSPEALKIARLNARQLNLEVHFEEKNALIYESSDEKMDVIVSNPPYIPEQEVNEMRTNVRAFEPHMALFVPDQNPLLFYEALTHIAIQQLKTGGLLFFELHEKFAEATQKMVEATGYFSSVELRNDLQGKPRMLQAIRNAN